MHIFRFQAPPINTYIQSNKQNYNLAIQLSDQIYGHACSRVQLPDFNLQSRVIMFSAWQVGQANGCIADLVIRCFQCSDTQVLARYEQWLRLKKNTPRSSENQSSKDFLERPEAQVASSVNNKLKLIKHTYSIPALTAESEKVIQSQLDPLINIKIDKKNKLSFSPLPCESDAPDRSTQAADVAQLY